VDAGSVLILSTVRSQVVTSCAGVAFRPVSPVGTVELLVRVAVFPDELLLPPQPASNAAPTSASASNVHDLRIIAAS
jgi:hypothetical protein